MTDKQIIIDGVDVRGWTDKEVYYKFEHHSPKAIRQIAFDLYQQLERKEQECETLASQLDFEVQKKECLEQECEKLKNWVKNMMFDTDRNDWFEHFVECFENWKEDLFKKIFL